MGHGYFAHGHSDVANLDHLSRATQHVSIFLVDSSGHLFAHLAKPTMAEPGETIVFLRKKKNGAVFAKVKTAPENSPAPITNPRLDVSVTNGGSPWDTAARLEVLPTDNKQFGTTSRQTMHVKRVRFADAEMVVGGLPHFSEHVSDDEFVPDKQTNVNVDGDDYLASCRTTDVPLGEDTDLLSPQSMTDYRSVVGTIGYTSSEFRPDLAWESSSLSRQFVTPTILDAKRANAALQYAQKNRVILKYRRGVENLTMFHDGSLGNLDDGKSQGGRIALFDKQD
jgi:hypothetical protein